MKKGRLYCVNHNLLHDIHEFFIHRLHYSMRYGEKKGIARNERIILKTNAVLRVPRDSSKVVLARATQTLIITT